MTHRCEGGTHHAACDCREAAHAAAVAELHAAIARNDERHAEAIAAVRLRAEHAEAEAARLRAALDTLYQHVLSAAPLTWASGGPSTEAAYAWERDLGPIRQMVDAAMGDAS